MESAASPVTSRSFVKRIKKRLLEPARLARRTTALTVQALDPTRLTAQRIRANADPGRAAFICVYRSRNASLVEDLAGQASALGMAVALWALDRPLLALSRQTVGSGQGLRLPLLNRLWAAVRGSQPGRLVVSDDDIAFTRGSLSLFVAAADRCGFDLAQPAHDGASSWNHRLTRGRAFTLARSTNFVEAGPMIVAAAPWLPRLFPFPEELGMGWGLELLWQDLLKEGCRFGIVDGVRICHLERRDYDPKREKKNLVSVMKARKITKLSHAQRCLGVWRPWQTEPPWLRAESRARVLAEWK